MPGVILLAPGAVFSDPNARPIHANATVTTSGSAVVVGYGATEVTLFINVKAAPTGTTPTLQYTIQEVDPGDGTTVIGSSVSSSVISGVGIQKISLISTFGGSIKVSWAVTGTAPSFTQVFATMVGKDSNVAISDRTTGPVAVKPASTAPVAADKALVVVLSPNQQAIPVTTAPAAASTGIATGSVILGGGTANTLNVIRATTYNEPAANAQRSLSSASASDTAAGTGAQQVTITYFDATGAGPFTEVVTLNGVTAVATVASNICFIESIVVTRVGATGQNVGVITLFVNNAGGGGTIGTIGTGNLVTGAGDRRTLWAHHYVQSGKTVSLATYIVSAVSGGSGTNAKFFLTEKAVLVAGAPEVVISDLLLTIGTITRTLGIPIKSSGFKRVAAWGVPGVNNASLTASFDFSEQ